MPSPVPPTFVWPMQLAADGSFATVPQDSATDLGQSVTLLLTSRIGERVDEPDYGTTDPTFDHLDVAELEAALAQWEPRADAHAIVQALESGTAFVQVAVDGRSRA